MTRRSAQRRIAEFAAAAPWGWGFAESAAIVRQALLDTLAVSAAAVRSTASRGAVAYATAVGGEGRAQPWLSSGRCAADCAALVDSVMAHALDYDDVTPAWRGHPSAVMFPALTTLGAQCGATGDDVLRAYVVGFEAGARLGQALAGQHYERGWHATSTIGVTAATVAGCRLLGLSADATSDAIGLALAQASGVQASFGSDVKALQAGFAAAGAVRACLLAANGIGSTDHVLDGPKGFVDLYAGDWAVPDPLAELGSGRAAIVEAGIEVKVFPMCYAAHRAIEAALCLRAGEPLDVAAIAAIEIEGSPGSHAPLLRTLPDDAQEARFSVEYGVACALLDGGVRLGSFTDAMFARPEIGALMRGCRVSESGAASGPRRGSVRLRMRDGGMREHTVCRAATGEVDRAVLMQKVVDCLASVGVPEEAEALQALCEDGLAAPVAAILASGPLARIRARIGADGAD